MPTNATATMTQAGPLVLVAGASGYIGSNLVPRLQQAGFRVRAGARHPEVLEGRGWGDVETVQADALDPASLDAALTGVEIAFYLIHSMGSGAGFAARDNEAAANFAGAARRAGVSRIIYLGGLQPPGESSLHLASRKETGDALRAGPVPVTEVRAGIVVGAGSAAFEVIRDLVNHLPVMTAPRWVRSRTQPIALDDLLSYLVGLAGLPESGGRTFDVGGPEVLSYADMLRQFGRVAGKRRVVLPLPVLTPRLSSYWLDLVTSVPASIARPLIDGLRHDLLADDAPIRALLPIPLSDYTHAVRSALDAERRQQVPARWTEGALAFRGYNAEVSYYAKGERTETACAAPPEALWAAASSIGGETGYFYANRLWQLRGLLDRAVGGVGMRRGRRHPAQLRVGDAVDFWRVVALEPGCRLTLRAEMRLPGSAILELEVLPDGEGSRLVTTARFHPAGLFGLLYWYSLVPAHNRIFRAMPRAIARRAEWLEAVVGSGSRRPS
ncbi:MAG: SDR family oxidoreductase [Dehalococcoidia bacterium]